MRDLQSHPSLSKELRPRSECLAHPGARIRDGRRGRESKFPKFSGGVVPFVGLAKMIPSSSRLSRASSHSAVRVRSPLRCEWRRQSEFGCVLFHPCAAAASSCVVLLLIKRIHINNEGLGMGDICATMDVPNANNCQDLGREGMPHEEEVLQSRTTDRQRSL